MPGERDLKNFAISSLFSCHAWNFNFFVVIGPVVQRIFLYRRVPVTLYAGSSSLRLVYFSDSVINVTIKVQGFEFFSEHFLRSRHRDVDISLKGIKVKADDDRFIGYVLTRNISSTIIAESETPLDIYSTSPDTLVFTFEKKNLKKFPTIKSSMITISSSKNKHDSSNADSFRNLTTVSHPGKLAKQKQR